MYKNIKSIFILKKPFTYISQNKYLKLVKYNKSLQKKFGLSIDDYFKHSNQIEIEIIPDQTENKEIKEFIYIINQNYEKFYYIYFNGKTKEVKRHYIKANETVSKIIVVIDMKVESIEQLFNYCLNIKEIKFIKFNRTDFTNYSSMFNYCTNLINLDISKLKTDNLKYMNSMFNNCSTLKYLNLSNFKKDNITDMYCLFNQCKSLEKIDLSNFKTNKVENIGKYVSWKLGIKGIKYIKF